jgi:hypothetical protein
LNGTNVGPYISTAPVNLASGDPILVSMHYANGIMQLQLSDQVSNITFTASLDVGDLPALLGSDSAYVGLTGGNGATASVQVVSNFSLVSRTALSLLYTETNTVVLSWPASALGYALEQNTGLAPTNWTTARNTIAKVNGQNQALITPSSNHLCYRLRLQ